MGQVAGENIAHCFRLWLGQGQGDCMGSLLQTIERKRTSFSKMMNLNVIASFGLFDFLYVRKRVSESDKTHRWLCLLAQCFGSTPCNLMVLVESWRSHRPWSRLQRPAVFRKNLQTIYKVVTNMQTINVSDLATKKKVEPFFLFYFSCKKTSVTLFVIHNFLCTHLSADINLRVSEQLLFGFMK